MARGDLCAATTLRQDVEGVLERQAHLLGIPSSCEACGYLLPVIDLHSEAIEAQRARPIGKRFGLVAEAVSRLARSTTSTQRSVRREGPSCGWRDSAVESQLPIVFVMPKRMRSVRSRMRGVC